GWLAMCTRIASSSTRSLPVTLISAIGEPAAAAAEGSAARTWPARSKRVALTIQILQILCTIKSPPLPGDVLPLTESPRVVKSLSLSGKGDRQGLPSARPALVFSHTLHRHRRQPAPAQPQGAVHRRG